MVELAIQDARLDVGANLWWKVINLKQLDNIILLNHKNIKPV